ncbi:MAG: FxLYD domain-containing protein [Halolamina sp.]
MRDNWIVLLVAILAGLLTYGGLVGGEALLLGDEMATADEAVVEGTTTHLDRSGRPTAVGEVTNRYGQPISNVSITVRFFDDGEQIAERTGTTLRGTIPSGEGAPFTIRMAETAEVDSVETSISYDRGGDVVTGLTLGDERVVRSSQDQVDVAATVTNEAGRPLRLSRVVGTFYNDTGATIGARVDRPNRQLEPGESVTVRLTFRTLGDVPSQAREYETFRLSVVAEEPE